MDFDDINIGKLIYLSVAVGFLIGFVYVYLTRYRKNQKKDAKRVMMLLMALVLFGILISYDIEEEVSYIQKLSLAFVVGFGFSKKYMPSFIYNLLNYKIFRR